MDRFEEHEGELQHLPWAAQSPIWTPLKHSGQVWRLEWGTDSHLQHLSSSLKMFFKKNGINSARDCSKVVSFHFPEDCSCIEGKRWSITMLI
jgi:hypothetical protein